MINPMRTIAHELSMLPAVNTPAERQAATRTVASLANNSDDCALLLNMLGLEAKPPRAQA